MTATPAELSLHNNFVTATSQLRRAMSRTLYYLQAINEGKVYRALGFATLESYARKHGKLSTRTVREMLTLARRLKSCPELEKAVDERSLSWRKALMISRRVLEDDDRSLIETAAGSTVRELQAALNRPRLPAPVKPKPVAPPATRGEGESPGDNTPSKRHGEETERSRPRSPDRITIATRERGKGHQYVTLKLSPEQYARWESALAGAGDVIETILHAVGGKDRDGPPFRLVILHCPACEKTELVTGRGDLPAPASLLARARCDGEVENGSLERRRTIAPRIRRDVMRRARYRCEAAGCRHTKWLEIHHRVPTNQGGRDETTNLIVLCSACHRRLHEREDALRRTVRNEPP